MEGRILHDYFAIRGGGERLVLTLGASLGWPVVGGFVSPDIPFGDEWPTVHLQALEGRIPGGAMRVPALIRAWSHYRPPEDLDAVLFSGVYAPLAGANFEAAERVYYCHTPPRFLYDQRAHYGSARPLWQRPLFELMRKDFRRRYEQAVAVMDRVVANSENVRARIQRYLGREASVVYPPCDTQQFRWQGQGDYYFSTARLDPLKRVDRIVTAFKELPDRRLLVASGGPELERLQRLASGAANISFTGWISEAEWRDLLGRAIATVYIPDDEDFGMSPVESMAAGKPVIGVAEGGLQESVVDGETGLLLPADPAPQDIVHAVESLTPDRALAMRGACEERAQSFRTELFLARMREVIGR